MSPRVKASTEESDRATSEVRTVDTMVKYLKIFMGIGGLSVTVLIGIGYKAATIDDKIMNLSMGAHRADSVREVMLANDHRADSVRGEMFIRIIAADTMRASMARDIALLHDRVWDLERLLSAPQSKVPRGRPDTTR